jgi:hypothetical protein
MANKVVKSEPVINEKVVVPLAYGDWVMKIVYENNGESITSEIIIDGLNKDSRSFRLAKDPRNTNFNFNGTEPDFELMQAIYLEVVGIINSFVKPEELATDSK